MGLFQMRVSCLLLMTVHQVTGIGMTTFASDLTKNKMKRSDIGAEATCSTPGPGQCDYSKSFTFAQAEKVCTDNNKKLCTKDEVKGNKCCGKGGSCDDQYIWTSTSSTASTPTQYWIERGCPRKSKDWMEKGKYAEVAGSYPMTVAGVQCCDQGQNTQAGDQGQNTQADDPVSINMGGAKRKDDNKNGGHNLYRPEAVHSEVCDTSLKSKVCKPCTSKAECWHGVDPSAMGINVPEGRAGFEYVAKIWASCTKKEGYWRVYIENLMNAQIKVYLNGQAVSKTIMKDSLYGDKVSYEMDHKQIGENAQIKIVLSPNAGTSLSQDSAGRATANIIIMAMANGWVDACMDRTYCLKELGVGSAAAFELRNSNRAQYDCLKGTAQTAALASVCGAWKKCFASQQGTKNHEGELLALLSAVFGKAPSSLVKTELLGSSSSGQIDEEDCADPAADDPEADQCECFDEAKKQCDLQGVADPEKCFRTLLCAHSGVCESWKTEAGCGDDSLLMRRGSRRSSMATTANGTRTSMAITAHGTLDDSVTGKCTSSTRT